jgi:drug/metabolite transporter (DMT)-like permease
MTDSRETSTGKKTAGAFDIRIIIAMLIGLYGVVLVVTGLVATSDADLDKADGVNINLWAGLGMAAVAAVFFVWARLRPIVVETPEEREEHRRG